jgi:hypothetical protein
MIVGNHLTPYFLLQNVFAEQFNLFASHHVLKYALSQEKFNCSTKVHFSFKEKGIR